MTEVRTYEEYKAARDDGGTLAVHADVSWATAEIWARMYEKGALIADIVSHPPHYTGHPSGVECIEVTEHMNFCRGNAVKYIWRAGAKGKEIEDLKKARWYIDREIARLEKKPD